MRRRWRYGVVAAAFALPAPRLTAQASADTPADSLPAGGRALPRRIAWVDGRWYTGAARGPAFARGARYTVDGWFVARRPPVIDTVIDLAGRWVVPPFADAHTHNLDGRFNLARVRDAYVREGTVYVQVLTNARSGADAVKARWNRPCDLDVRYANGGLTSTLSHPFLAYEPRAMGLYDGARWHDEAARIRTSRLRLGDAYWFMDSAADVAAQWPRILAGRPDLLKVYLLDATETPPAPPDTGLPSGHGLRPSVLRDVVHRARAAGLPVAAHVETTADARLAVDAGATMLAHVPGYTSVSAADSAARLLTAIDAAAIARRGVVITPTAQWTAVGSGPDSAAVVARTRAVFRANLARLRAAGARVIVGSDWYGRTAWPEIAALRTFGVWRDRELLNLWAVATPRALYPDRRIGALRPGYEASFVVLDADPTRSFATLRGGVALAVKQGCLLAPSTPAAERAGGGS